MATDVLDYIKIELHFIIAGMSFWGLKILYAFVLLKVGPTCGLL
jgi:hypothetical protein